MTRAVCSAPLVPAARAFMEDVLGWTVEERASVGADADAAVAIVEAERIGADELAQLPALELIVCVRGDPVNVDLAAATARGLPVLHAPGRNAESVAEFTICLVIALLRHVVRAHELVRRRVLTEARDVPLRDRRDVVWRPQDSSALVPYHAFTGRGLRSSTLGIVGLGAIGRHVARLAHALGMPVVGHDPHLASPVDDVPLVSLPELLAACDVLSLHARSAAPPLIGAAELALLKPGAVLVNTARATVLDYAALADALRSGRLAGAALDVYPDEPLTPDDPLLDLDNVILTPHIAGASTDVAMRQWEILVEGLRHLLVEGRPEAAPIRNPEVLVSRRPPWNALQTP
jgi:phosphoglycerate dehydrogenase-like enzyme